MRTRIKTPSERAIIYAGVLGNLTLEQVNDLLVGAGFPGDLPKSSWEMLHRAYRPRFLEEPVLLGECIYSPRAVGDLELSSADR